MLRTEWRPWLRGLALVGVSLCLAAVPAAAQDKLEVIGARREVKTGKSYRIPYQLTETKHVLVRTKFNGKGPFNFIVDTGAPALFISTDAAKKAGIKAEKTGWSTVESFEIEGGIKHENFKARVETPFQLTGMNSMNLAGVRLDGMMGYTVLAQYKMELDLTKPHMVWTELQWTPPEPQPLIEAGGAAPPELAAMSGMAGLMSLFVSKRPNPVFIQRGFYGIELAEVGDKIIIKSILPDSPAATAKLAVGDQLVKFQGKSFKNLAELHKLATEQAEANKIALEVERNGKSVEANLEPRKGL